MSQRLPGQANVYSYRRGPAQRRVRQNDGPEHRLQVAVAEYLRFALPENYLWTSIPAGMRGSIQQGVKAKAAGLHPGWPDLVILGPGGGLKCLELKSESGDLSAAQKVFYAHCLRTGTDMYAVCRSLEEVEAALIRWRVPVRCPLAKANRYS